MPSRLRPAVLTGLKGAARNPTALTALRPAGSCNSAVSAVPSAAHFTALKPTGFLFLIFQCAVSSGTPLFPGRGRLNPFNGKVRGGRITVWNTRIAAHRTTAHFFRYPHPPRAGVVLVLIQYHATRPGGIAAPPSPAPRVGYAHGHCGYAPVQLVPLMPSCSELRAGCMPFMRRVTCERNKIFFLLRSSVSLRVTLLHYPLYSVYLMCYLSISQKRLLYLRILRESEAAHLLTR